MRIVEILFFVVLASIAYTYFIFPLLLFLRAVLFAKPVATRQSYPPVSLIVAAHNEEGSIGNKIDNILQLDYPTDKLQVLVASDGSTDASRNIVCSYADRGVEFLDLPRKGKANALNAAVKMARGDILVFSDANSMFAADAIIHLVAPFADPGVGGVAGDQRYRKSSNGENEGEKTYWNLDRMFKRWESAAGHVISATGAIYAIRKSLFQSVPDGVTDDFVTSTRVILQGHRLVFAEKAAAYEPVAASTGVEFSRKVRVMTRGLRGVLMVRSLLNPFQFGFYSIQLFSHKVLRRLMVVPLIMLYLLNAILAPQATMYAILFGLQSMFYIFAMVGIITKTSPIGRWRAIKIPAYFCMVNAAALVALINTIRGRRIDRWNPQRSMESDLTR